MGSPGTELGHSSTKGGRPAAALLAAACELAVMRRLRLAMITSRRLRSSFVMGKPILALPGGMGSPRRLI